MSNKTRRYGRERSVMIIIAGLALGVVATASVAADSAGGLPPLDIQTKSKATAPTADKPAKNPTPPSPPAAVAAAPKEAPPVTPQVSPRGAAVASEIASINERLAVLQAKLAELEIKAKIATKESEIRKTIGVVDETFPSVLYIDGIDGKQTATLLMPNGSTQIVHAGENINQWKIKHIKTDSVVLSKGKELRQLPFTTQTNTSTTPSGTGPSPMGLPLPPPPAGTGSSSGASSGAISM